ncbi:MAG: PorT family protein [Cyclobacteriaceae bacterium]|jgi:hypothetical protein|nr:PorT family protein [Cyclobacteriaceae bacterium]
MRILSIIFFAWISAAALQAQETTVDDVLNRATEAFSVGHFSTVRLMLSDSLTRKMSNEQKQRTFAMLAQVYLILDKPRTADSCYLLLLRANPEFVPTPETDPIDIVYLSQKFTTRPLFTPHVRLGMPLAWATNLFSTNTSSLATDASQSVRPNVEFGAGIEWNYNDHFSIGTEALLSFRSYGKRITGISLHDEVNIIDKQSWVDVPLYLKYSDSKGKWRPYGYAGAALNLLLSSRATIGFINRSPSLGVETPEEGVDVNTTDSRYLINRSLLLGAGVKYKYGKDFFFAEVRYMAGLNNQTKPDQVYVRGDEGTLVPEATKYQYVFGLFRLNAVSISVGYVRPIYQPRVIKRASTKQVMRKINKKK